MSRLKTPSDKNAGCLNIVRHWTVLLLVNTDHQWQKPSESSFFVHKLSSCKNFKCLFIHWHEWLPLRHGPTPFVYHWISWFTARYFLLRDSTCRRWYRHLRRCDPLLFTCASAHEKLGGQPLCSGSVWDARLRIYIDLTCLPSERNTSFNQQKEGPLSIFL